MSFLIRLIYTALAGLWLGWAVQDLAKKRYMIFGFEVVLAIAYMADAIRISFVGL